MAGACIVEGARMFGDENMSLAEFARSREQLTLLAAITTTDARITNQRITPPSMPLRHDPSVAFMSSRHTRTVCDDDRD
ncbi:MAG: hypothetical protein DMF99_07945 [Acidobacteria bacterium]|nr:MAG: hypothetical protein DMF99_07945 [Acidobacteriota bacterium]